MWWPSRSAMHGQSLHCKGACACTRSLASMGGSSRPPERNHAHRRTRLGTHPTIAWRHMYRGILQQPQVKRLCGWSRGGIRRRRKKGDMTICACTVTRPGALLSQPWRPHCEQSKASPALTRLANESHLSTQSRTQRSRSAHKRTTERPTSAWAFASPARRTGRRTPARRQRARRRRGGTRWRSRARGTAPAARASVRASSPRRGATRCNEPRRR